MISHSDKEELLNSILAENKARFIFIASSHAPREDVMDLYQEMLRQIWKSLDSYESRSSPGTWAYRVALQTACSFRRKRWQRLKAWRQYTRSMASTDRNGSHPRGEAEILEEFLGSLEKADRAVFVLYLSNLSYREMAEITGIAEANLRVKVNRIKGKYEERYIRRQP